MMIRLIPIRKVQRVFWKRVLALVLVGLLCLAIAACAPAGTGSGVSSAVPGSVLPTQGPVILTGVVSTAMVGTLEPHIATGLPPGYTPPPTAAPPTPTPIPTLAGALGPIELKYRVLEQFPDLFFCDPDFYPVAHEDEAVLALQRFAEVQANSEEFNAILEHNGLDGSLDFTDEQKLLVYREHKKLAAVPFELVDGGYRFQMMSAKTEGEGTLVTGLVDSQGKITVEKKEKAFAACPICLAAATLIDTPGGPIPVQALRTGSLVWTLDQDGERAAYPLLRMGSTRVPRSHKVVHLALEDGRELWASPGHPTADGRLVGDLRSGDLLDGSRILSAERVPYTGGATFDLLPGGGTGFYWANGILIASTLQ